MRLRDTLLLMGGEHSSRSDLREIFSNTYNILEASNREQLLSLLQQNESCIAAMILDIPPVPSRDESITHQITSNPRYKDIPVIIVIPRENVDLELLAYEYGAADAISKPYNPQVMYRRVQTILELSAHKNSLEFMVNEQAEILRRSNEVMVDALSSIIEYRSAESGRHVQRIRHFAQILLQEIARVYPEYGLTDQDIQSIVSAATLHDIGKISIPDHILNKPSRLTDAEFEVMKNHTFNGAHIIKELSGIADQKYLRYAYNIALYHHERWDGGGYPKHLKGNEIPICAQVTALVDVYDALTTDRAYKDKIPHAQAVNMILNGECGAFNPKILECFKRVRDRFAELADIMADGSAAVSEEISRPLPHPDDGPLPVDSLQMLQMKYQTLLHYVDATVLEVDFSSGIYHIIFNPDPDFILSSSGPSFFDAIAEVKNSIVHPADRSLVKEFFLDAPSAFLEQGVRKRTCTFRMYSSALADYLRYRITVLQIGSDAAVHNAALVILTPEKTESASFSAVSAGHSSEILQDISLFHDLVGTVICLNNDKHLSILQGAEYLFSLSGYKKEELLQEFGGSFMNLVLPEDRPVLRTQMNQQLAYSSYLETEFRIKKKNGSPLWILIKGRLSTSEDGTECLYVSLVNNSKSRSTRERLEFMLQRNEIIMNQTDDIIFEWDMINDTFDCSSRWEKRFGYVPAQEAFSRNLFRLAHIHPDDLDRLASALRSMREGFASADLECRIINSSGRYTWNRIRATTQVDTSGIPIRAIGVITDIDRSKRMAQSLQEKAERDALTGLLNREAAQQRISSAILSHDEKLLSAMLMIDLDNFKMVNDTYGHLFGDAVLTRTAEEIKKLFRNNDIISRIGGDEFMIFLNGIPSEDLVRTRCSMLVERLREAFAEMIPDSFVSCSVGAALYPVHGMSYLTLYQKADQALYFAKSSGKNQYMVYGEAVEAAPKGLISTINSHIDSDVPSAGGIPTELIQSVVHRLYETRDPDSTIREVLSDVGRTMSVSRVYIFENSRDNNFCSNTYEWCNDGISPQKEFLQNISYRTGPVMNWDRNFDTSDIFYCADINKLADGPRQVLEEQDVKAILQCAIRDRGVFRGYVGFDECDDTRLWTQDQVSTLVFLSEILSIFLLKKRNRDRMEQLADNLMSILDSQDAWIYAIDPLTFRLQYANQRTRSISPRVMEGSHCYEVLLNKPDPCRNCPARNLETGEHRKTTITNDYLGLTVHCEASHIRLFGKDACLLTCRQV